MMADVQCSMHINMVYDKSVQPMSYIFGANMNCLFVIFWFAVNAIWPGV